MNYLVWAVLAALIWGVVPLIEKMGLSRVDPLIGLFYRCIGVLAGLLLLSVYAVRSGQITSIDRRSLLLLVSGGFLASIVAQICFYHSLKTGEISRAVPIAGSFPLISFVLGVVFLGESLSLVKIVGVLLIVGGIWALKVG